MTFRIREFREQFQNHSSGPGSEPEPTGEKQQERSPLGLVVAFSPDASARPLPLPAEDDRMVDRRTQAAIGQQLRSLYNDIATAPVPDKLLSLLDDLESKTSGGQS